jgi:acetyl-CoA carboxylase biotin carboxylase subunit
MPSIETILIANRGEIAARIIRTCRQMGIRTVAVYSDADTHAPYVRAADTAVRLRGNAPAETYLDMDRILAAAKVTGADAIHPGYGFLAENAEFARKCAENDLIFIGPHPEAIAAMGSKSEAKRIMAEHEVPVVPGYQGEDHSPARLIDEAKKIGYPVLLKAVAGGGGKGMRIVHAEEEMEAAVAAAKSEAQSAFGDEQIILEKYFTSVRHIEFQIFGDQHGNAIHLLERECTIQRRYQKIIEESPSPAMTAELREEMGAAAVRAAKALKYDNAGTVEFILDQDGQFYFLEVNTRLQVEHPVTEMITGLDLVEWQIRLANGEKLPLQQEEVEGNGYALECRLYAEDADNNFMPDTGTLLEWQLPEVDGLRVDSGVEKGSVVSVWYDPMLAKLIVHGRDRAEAMRKMRYVLREMYCPGLTTNREFLMDLLANEKVQRGEYDTHFLAGERKNGHKPTLSLMHFCAAIIHQWQHAQPTNRPLRSIPRGWRNSYFQAQIREFEVDGEKAVVKYREEGNEMTTWLGEKEYGIRNVRTDGGTMSLEIDGLRCKVLLARDADGGWWAQSEGRQCYIREVERFPLPGQHEVQGGYRAPMPSQVLRVMVEAGQQVEEGEALLVLSSMKMENTIDAASAGTVEEVLVAAGDTIEADTELLIFKEKEAEA